ncbi:MAG TPA: exodeoxyribonuclease VII large subunit [Terriglobales bacterium]|nr:exodeoxyribonuclease VII large subunit [Terriglobales bacterium]
MSSPDQLGFTFQPPQRRVWTVRELVSDVRTHLERQYADLWVQGEISNYRPAESGHLYFTLKEDGAQIQIVMFRSQARLLRFRPENGLQVIARGRVTIYEDRGQLQMLAEYLEPKGAGALQVAFEQLKAKLAAEGLFEQSRKKPIPALPRRIGLVTSPRGAAVQDILNILRRRHKNVNVLIYPAQVQGEGASSEVSAGVRYFNRAKNVDVVIVARGGGSIEDLAAFNEEGLARTVAASAIPVISAVGHETDFTICDFVADMRAPTPSAAAELVIRSKQSLEDGLGNLRQRLARAMRYQLLDARNAVTELTRHRAFARTTDLIHRRQQRVDELTYRMRMAVGMSIQRYRQRLESDTARLHYHDIRRSIGDSRRVLDGQTATLTVAVRNMFLHRRHQLERLAGRLEALSPVAILERGYALVFDERGVLVKHSAQVRPGDDVTARLAHGTITATVKDRQ